MERFYKRKAPEPGSGNNLRNSCLDDLNWEEEIKYDPGLRKQIDDYHPNHRESVRRKYLENRPCQPRTLDFPVTYIGGAPRRILLQQGLSFRGHDESKESLNKGNFREFRNFAAEQNPALRKAIGTSGSDNSLLIAPEIQRDIVHCFAKEVLHSILEEIGDDVFCLLVDESRDVSWKEQMAVVLRYVDKCGIVKERFVGLVHVTETTSAHLKSAIDALLANLKLSLKQVRGQGYDGASNMRDVKDDDRFFNLQTVAELSQKMVETRKHERYPLVYRLMKLVLVLPVATATVERIFSGMKIVKTNLRNRIGDEFMNNCLLCYVEKEEMMKVTNNAVVRRFMKMQGRRYQDED